MKFIFFSYNRIDIIYYSAICKLHFKFVYRKRILNFIQLKRNVRLDISSCWREMLSNSNFKKNNLDLILFIKCIFCVLTNWDLICWQQFKMYKQERSVLSVCLIEKKKNAQKNVEIIRQKNKKNKTSSFSFILPTETH